MHAVRMRAAVMHAVRIRALAIAIVRMLRVDRGPIRAPAIAIGLMLRVGRDPMRRVMRGARGLAVPPNDTGRGPAIQASGWSMAPIPFAS
jgi:hypothetical protein